EFGTNGGPTNLVNNEATSSGSSFINLDNDGEFVSNTLIGEKIDKIEQKIGKGKLRLLDNDGNPLVSTGIMESDSEVEVVFDDTSNLRISTSDKNGSTEHLLSICDDLDIMLGFFNQKGSRGGRGVKEKSLNRNSTNNSSGIGVSTKSDDTMNEDTLVGVASVVKEGVTPSMVYLMMEKDKLSSLDDNTVLKPFLPLSTPVITDGNAPAYGFFLGKKVAYPIVANYVRNTWDAMLNNGPWFIWNNPLIQKKWHPDENLLKEDVSIVPVWVKLHGVPVSAFSKDSLSAIATKLGTPLMLDSYTSDMCIQSWGRSSYARVTIKLRVDVDLKDNIAMAMPKITMEGHYSCNVRVEYEWKPPRCSSCKVFGHIHEECLKNTEYRTATKKHNASSSGNKKKGVEPTIKVSNSNPFDVLNSVDNDVEFVTNWGTNNLVNNKATSSGSSFMNINNDGKFSSNTPIVPTSIVESDSEVEVVFDETANLRISMSGKDRNDKGYGTNSLLEQWKDSNINNDDYDPYDDDMYENHDLSEHQ
nr:hypothetical protein [Tanacetum cinerariifolium]